MLFNELKAGFADPTTIEQKKQRFDENPDAATAKSLASYFQTQNEIAKAVTYYGKAQKYDPQSDFSEELFDLYNSGYRRDIYSLDELLDMTDIVLEAKKSDLAYTLGVYAQMSNYASADPDNKKLLDYIKTGSQLLADNSNEAPAWTVRYLTLNHALFVEKNPEKALEIKKNSLKKGWENDAGQLNSFAWWCFENKINLQEAAELGRRGVKLAEPGRGKAMIIDTVAEIENLRGNPREAVKLMEQAVKEDPASDQWKKQLERFKKTAEQS